MIKIINTDIFIPKTKFNGAKDGDKVIVKMLGWDDKSKNPEGEITEVLGHPGDHETEIHSILAEYGLPYNFPPEVEAEAQKLTRHYQSRKSPDAGICAIYLLSQ